MATALHKLHLAPPSRYSEDIDLVQRHSGQGIGDILNTIRRVIDPILGRPARKQHQAGSTLLYRIESEGPPSFPIRIKLEINTREHFQVLAPDRKSFRIDSGWFSDACTIETYQLPELLGTKLRALYQRRKGRDLFDLWLGLTAGKANPRDIVECFRRYMSNSGFKLDGENLKGT